VLLWCGTAAVARSGKRCGEEAGVVPAEGHGIPHGIKACRGGFRRARMTREKEDDARGMGEKGGGLMLK
jgi:hypothetical protein